ncbi:MAG: TatD family hydrolase [Desulfobulbaceae bacterium]|nr:TatD family hydrolase [Desulfobulbaceae bacterium]
MSKKKKHIPLPVLGRGAALVDTHCHLDMIDEGLYADRVIDRALAAGVKAVITIGIDMKSSRKAVEFAKNNPGVYASVGIHPHHAGDLTDDALDELDRLARNQRVVAYGEIGIDTVKDYAPLPVQHSAFTRQLHLAKRLGLPVIIHNREAHEQIYELLEANGPFPAAGVIHCFSGDGATAKKFIDLGFYISIPGVVTFNNAQILHDAVRAIPLSRLLVETDAPFLAPVPFRGKTNEPAYTLYTTQKIAELKDVTLDAVARQTTANVQKLFGISV